MIKLPSEMTQGTLSACCSHNLSLLLLGWRAIELDMCRAGGAAEDKGRHAGGVLQKLYRFIFIYIVITEPERPSERVGQLGSD